MRPCVKPWLCVLSFPLFCCWLVWLQGDDILIKSCCLSLSPLSFKADKNERISCFSSPQPLTSQSLCCDCSGYKAKQRGVFCSFFWWISFQIIRIHFTFDRPNLNRRENVTWAGRWEVVLKWSFSICSTWKKAKHSNIYIKPGKYV